MLCEVCKEREAEALGHCRPCAEAKFSAALNDMAPKLAAAFEATIKAEEEAEHQNFCGDCGKWAHVWECATCHELVCNPCIPAHECK